MNADDLINQALDRDDLAVYRERGEITALKKERERLLARCQGLEDRLDVIAQLRAARQPALPITQATRKGRAKIRDRREATAVVLCSDWHVEETVDPASVNGRNAYDPEVCARRVIKLAEGVEWLVRSQSASHQISNLIVWLGGDLITGYIHEELVESNALSPTEAVLFAQAQIVILLDLLLKIDGIKITVPCNYGNHGRTTMKSRISTGATNSYEWLLYHTLRAHYAKNPRIQFQIADGEHTYLDVYEHTIRFTHGDSIGYGGGVGGVSIPLNKAIAQWEKFKPAAITNIGHFHQYLSGERSVINGSLIGYGAYSLRIKAAFEPPRQAYYLIDAKRGKTISTAIWVDQ